MTFIIAWCNPDQISYQLWQTKDHCILFLIPPENKIAMIPPLVISFLNKYVLFWAEYLFNYIVVQLGHILKKW